MPRPQPAAQPPSFCILKDRRQPLFELDIDVVTPMFGGGAVPREADPQHPVRGSSVRGHLRFWWRACRAGRFDTVEALFAREQELWGGTAGAEGAPSTVDVHIQTLSAGKVTPIPTSRQAGPAWPEYALFPFREERGRGAGGGQKAANAIVGCRFHLTILPASAGIADDIEGEVEAAVWTWLQFGGVGARTRRGCGSLQADATSAFSAPPHPSWVAWLRDGLQTRMAPRSTLAVPSLYEKLVPGPVTPSAIDAWAAAIDALQRFRQLRDTPQSPSSGRRSSTGKSRWPEARAIRCGSRSQAGFPKADLGLPIVFGRMEGNPTLDAAGEGARRMASPLILKPLVLRNGTAVPLALLLRAPGPFAVGAPGACLTHYGKAGPLVADPASSRADVLGGAASAPLAFIDFLQELWAPKGGGR
ncbi:MAG: type III-B CRISPR module RAMP protein Cmr1 [Chloroflexota bacterium]